MAIPATFTFSQSSLGDYQACPRRFQLRYVERLAWPAPQSADAVEAERRQRLGQEFHRLVRRHQAGVPAAALTSLAAADAELAGWWAAYLGSPYSSPAAPLRRAEMVLSAPLGGYRLEAQYDLVAGSPGGDWLIIDWKTERHRPAREWLARRVQTTVYRCVLALAGGGLNGGPPIPPERITMTYWFAAFPLQPECYPYDAAQFERDREALAAMIAEIAARPEGAWPQAEDERVCRFCAYRSLCERQVPLATLAEFEAEGEAGEPGALALDLDQIEEVAF